MNDEEFVYGYGRTKHIRDPYYLGPTKGLCGAFGGYPMDAPDRPLCKRCERKARAAAVVSVPEEPAR